VGEVSSKSVFSEDMKGTGTTLPWIAEHVVKKPADLAVLGYIFENLEVEENYEAFHRCMREKVGDDGIGAAFGLMPGSPMQFIQRDFLDATEFFIYYKDHAKELAEAAGRIGVFFEKAARVTAASRAEAVLWGCNFDDMITYPPYYEKDIMPWMARHCGLFNERGIITIAHCDGENLGLMDLLRDTGFQVAEAICPFPMTKVRIGEYYRRWHEKLVIFGGIPSNILLEDIVDDDGFDGYLDEMLKAVVPGDRLIVGIADTTPPNASWDRLRRLGDRLRQEGRLPLAGDAVLVDIGSHGVQPRAAMDVSGPFGEIRRMVIEGDDENISAETGRLLSEGHGAAEIMRSGLIAAMDIIGPQFRDGVVFIPEVLLSARAMNLAVDALEPFLGSKDALAEQKTVVLGTVFGDLHDIGKNMVATMLKGAGFKIIDLGINVPAKAFVEAVKEHQPEILGLSALLTTTMPEMAKTVATVTESGLRGGLKIMVGGAPLNAKFARDIGADGYSADASQAVELARRLAG
jgi:methanogenic corrinoid protein MtbC1